jgi:hypothetical protein
MVYLGEFEQLDRALVDLLAAADRRGDVFAGAALRSGLPNLVWLAQNRPDEAQAQAERAIAVWRGSEFQLQHYFDLLARTQLALYAGEPDRAHEQVVLAWPKLKASLSLRVQNFRVTLLHLRGRIALSRALAGGPQAARLLAETIQHARALEREEEQPWARALALGLEAGAKPSRDAFGRAAVALAGVDMAIHAAAARMRMGGAEAARAEAAMRERGVAEPARMAALLMPARD